MFFKHALVYAFSDVLCIDDSLLKEAYRRFVLNSIKCIYAGNLFEDSLLK